MQPTVEENTYMKMRAEGGKVLNNMTFIVAKCLSGDAKISTPQGRVPLAALPDDGLFPVFSFNVALQKIEQDTARKIRSGRKQVYEIETASGRKVKASADHVFFCLSGSQIVEKPLRDLREGDALIVE